MRLHSHSYPHTHNTHTNTHLHAYFRGQLFQFPSLFMFVFDFLHNINVDVLFRMQSTCSDCTWHWKNSLKLLALPSSSLERSRMLVSAAWGLAVCNLWSDLGDEVYRGSFWLWKQDLGCPQTVIRFGWWGLQRVFLTLKTRAWLSANCDQIWVMRFTGVFLTLKTRAS